MRRLVEVDYKDIFSPKTMDALKGKSGESLRQMLGNKSLMQTLTKTQGLLDDIFSNYTHLIIVQTKQLPDFF
jgi:hypothetical protein